jgi:hypothetical protein
MTMPLEQFPAFVGLVEAQHDGVARDGWGRSLRISDAGGIRLAPVLTENFVRASVRSEIR